MSSECRKDSKRNVAAARCFDIEALDGNVSLNSTTVRRRKSMIPEAPKMPWPMLGGWRERPLRWLALVLLLATGVQTAARRLHYEGWRKLRCAGQNQADAQIAARKAEAEKAQAIATIADKYEQDKRMRMRLKKRLVGDLRGWRCQLQDRWRGCVRRCRHRRRS